VLEKQIQKQGQKGRDACFHIPDQVSRRTVDFAVVFVYRIGTNWFGMGYLVGSGYFHDFCRIVDEFTVLM
jgi:hypothetical protein